MNVSDDTAAYLQWARGQKRDEIRGRLVLTRSAFDAGRRYEQQAGRIEPLAYSPERGDLLVFTAPQRLAATNYDRTLGEIKRTCESLGVKALLLDDGLTLDVLRRERTEYKVVA